MVAPLIGPEEARPVWSYDAPIRSGTQLVEVAVPQDPTAAAAISSTLRCREVVLCAPYTNGAVVYVGFAGVTKDTGLPLGPGDRIGFNVEDAALLFAVSADAGQKLRALVVVT